VELIVTLACNAKCDFCSNKELTVKENTIGIDKYKEIIDQCAKMDVPIVSILGGEPLLYKRLNEQLSYINSKKIMASITTNGFFLTKEKVKELASNGLRFVGISIMSADEKEHDRIMGLLGCYRRIMEAQEFCRDNEVQYSWCTVVTHNSFNDGSFDRLVNLALKRDVQLNINPFTPTSHALGKGYDLLRLEDVEKLNELCKTSTLLSSHLTNNYFGFGCPAGNAYLIIHTNVDILPCYYFPVSLGNVHTVSLRDAWLNGCRSPLFNNKHKMCWAGTSREFYCEYLKPIFEGGRAPIPIEEHPKYDHQHNFMTDLKCQIVKDAIEYIYDEKKEVNY